MTASGAASWSFRFRDKAGKQTRATIGTYPAVRLKTARTKANALRTLVAGGGNPNQDRRAARASANTFGALADRYLEEHSRRHKRSHPADERNLRKHVLPRWRNRLFADIRRADVVTLIERIIADEKPTLANRVQALISSIFSFAIDAGLREDNPCNRLKKRGVEQLGRRVLSDGEIRLFWDGIVSRAAPIPRPAGLGLRLALLTMTRIGEVAGINRGEFDWLGEPGRAAWTIPGARTKNGRDHLIPLSSLARDTILDLLDTIQPGEHYLLPTRSKRRGGSMTAKALWQVMSDFGHRLDGDDIAVRTWKADPPSPHDLRRTGSTRLAELRIPKEIRDRVLNHIPGDVGSRHYNLHDFADEKREALTRWASAAWVKR
jgi:integrase